MILVMYGGWDKGKARSGRGGANGLPALEGERQPCAGRNPTRGSGSRGEGWRNDADGRCRQHEDEDEGEGEGEGQSRELAGECASACGLFLILFLLPA